MTRKFSGKSEAKGRNGDFKLAEAHAYDLSRVDQGTPPIVIDLYSKCSGDAPPIRLKLVREDAKTLRTVLSRALEGKL